MKFFNGFLFAVGLLALPVATSQALAAAKAQTLTTGNNAWDVASTSLGVTGVTTVALYNSGSVTVHVAFATAAPTDPEYILGAGERLTLTFPRTSSPSVIWTKGVSAGLTAGEAAFDFFYAVPTSG